LSILVGSTILCAVDINFFEKKKNKHGKNLQLFSGGSSKKAFSKKAWFLSNFFQGIPTTLKRFLFTCLRK